MFGVNKFTKLKLEVAGILGEVVGALIETTKARNEEVDKQFKDLKVRHDSLKLTDQDHLNRIAELERNMAKAIEKIENLEMYSSISQAHAKETTRRANLAKKPALEKL